MRRSKWNRLALRATFTALTLSTLGLMVPDGALAAPTCSTLDGTRTCTFAVTGAEDTFTVPAGITSLHVVVAGASGGVGAVDDSPGGRGASVTADLPVTPGSVLYVAVGGTPTGAGCYPDTACVGGFNGGGSTHYGGGGGGASDLRTVARAQPATLASRLVVAAGGGGGGVGWFCSTVLPGGAGGNAGAAGGNAPPCSGTPSTGGGAGTQAAGGAGGSPSGLPGSPGQGGNGGGGAGGGGGGGLYGGGGGGDWGRTADLEDLTPAGGGGGGSNLVPAGGTATLAAGAATVAVSFPAPSAGNDIYTTGEDTTLTVAAPGVLGNDSDPQGDPLAAALVSGPAHGDLTLNADGSFTYEPAAGYVGPDSFTYRAGDGTLDSSPATVSITVSAVNDAPTCSGVSATTAEDTAVDVAPDCADVDSASLSYAIVTPPAHGTATVVAGQLHYTPAADFNGADAFTYAADDGSLDSAAATVSITVTAANDAPTCTALSATTAEDTAVDVAPACADIDSASLTYAIVDPPAHGTATVVAGQLHYTPAAEYNGPDTFTYQAGDGALDSTAATVTVTVGAVDDGPACDAVSATTTEDTAVEVAPACTDVDGSPLTYAVVAAPAHGTATVVAGRLRYTPAADFNGTDAFTYQASDGGRESTPVAAAVTVGAVNDRPVCSPVAGGTNEDTAVDVAPACSDVDSPALSHAIAAAPAHGSAAVVAGALRYTPAAGFHGADGFTYRASDGSLDSTPAPVAITVQATPVPTVVMGVSVPSLSVLGKAGSPARCRVDAAELTACSVTLRKGGRVLARGRATADGARTLTVELALTKRGRRLLGRSLGGVRATVRAVGTTSAGRRSAKARTRAILATERFTTAPGSWLPSQALLSDRGRRFVRSLRGRLIAVASARCDGHTARIVAESAAATRISLERAELLCAALERQGVDVPTKSVGHGASDPIAPNTTPEGLARNRRVEVTIRHRRQDV